MDFVVKVTPRSSELIFEKGNTDESSSATDPLTSHGEHSRPLSEEESYSKEYLPKRVSVAPHEERPEVVLQKRKLDLRKQSSLGGI